MAYIENGAGRLETRDADGEFAHRVPEQRPVQRRRMATPTSSSRSRSASRRASTLPVGGYDFASVRTGVQLRASSGASRATSRSSTARSTTATRRRSASAAAGVKLTPQFSLEPSFSVNWVDLVGRLVHDPTLVGSRVTYTMTPLMFVERAAAVQLGQQRRVAPTCACAGNTGPAASCSSSTTRSATRWRAAFPSSRTARCSEINRLFRF